MTFGSASIGTHVATAMRQAEAQALLQPSCKKRSAAGGGPAKRYDCGRHGILTVKQIAKKAGITNEGVHARIRRGGKGEALCRSKPTARRIGFRRRTCNRPLLLTAVRLAVAFPNGMPTVAEIRDVYPMSATAAGRWRSAIRDIREELGLPL